MFWFLQASAKPENAIDLAALIEAFHPHKNGSGL